MAYRSARARRSAAMAHDLAYGLGWFSIALGAAELIAPQALARILGMRGNEQLLRAYGIREIATGFAVLSSKDPAPWVWTRVGGDALDLATLATGFHDENPKRENVGLALAAVAGVTALDVFCAAALSSDRKEEPLRLYDYRDRSRFPVPAEAMRGAAGDYEAPRDFRTPEALRPYSAA